MVEAADAEEGVGVVPLHEAELEVLCVEVKVVVGDRAALARVRLPSVAEELVPVGQDGCRDEAVDEAPGLREVVEDQGREPRVAERWAEGQAGLCLVPEADEDCRGVCVVGARRDLLGTDGGGVVVAGPNLLVESPLTSIRQF